MGRGEMSWVFFLKFAPWAWDFFSDCFPLVLVHLIWVFTGEYFVDFMETAFLTNVLLAIFMTRYGVFFSHNYSYDCNYNKILL